MKRKFKYDFSIIMPIYNSEKYLKKSINSVIKQKYDFNKVEIILINDGSKDKSLNICEKYKKKYNNVVLIDKKNNGVSSARNDGLKIAKGKYILFLDSDDYLENNVLSHVFAFFEKHNNEIDIVVYPLKYLRKCRLVNHHRYKSLYKNKTGIYDINIYPEVIQTTINYCIKNKFTDNLLFNEKSKFSEDEEYATKVIMKKEKLGYISDAFYIYRKHSENTNANYKIDQGSFNKFFNYYKGLLETYKNSLYIKNIVLNSFKWRIDSSKLFPKDKSAIDEIKDLLGHFSIEDIQGYNYLKSFHKQLLIGIKNDKIDNSVFILSLMNNKFPKLNGLIISENIIKEKEVISKEYTIKINPLKSSNDDVYYYDFDILLNQKHGDIALDFISTKVNFFINNITYKLKYQVYKRKNFIAVEKLSFSEKIYKILRKLTKRNFSKRNTYLFQKAVYKKIIWFPFIWRYKLFSLIHKQDPKRIFFFSKSRNDLSGNIKFIYDEIIKDDNYKVNYFVKFVKNYKFSFRDKNYIAKMMAKSKYIFLDDYCEPVYEIKLRKNTKLVQLWHAMGAFKKFGYSRPEDNETFNTIHKNYTDAIVSSENIRKDYAEGFGISIDKVHPTGIPRTDIFFDKNYKKDVIERIYKKYPRLKGKKVIMFAPTFRGDGPRRYYDFKLIDFKKLEKEFGEDYVFIIKLHPFIHNKPDFNFEKSKFYIDLTSEREINDLLFITDILITDYSSVIFEYSFFERPVVFYLPDLEEYKNKRDIYYPLEDYLYGDVATNMKELVSAIKKKKVDKKKIKEFKEYFCSACDGNSTKKVIEKILGD